MSRFLFTVPPLVGHINPTSAVARELVRRGHEVAWASCGAFVAEMLPPGARLFVPRDVDGRELDDRVSFAELRTRAAGQRGAAAFRFLWEEVLLPLTVLMVPAVERAVEAFAPHVVVADQQALAGAVVARRHREKVRWATSATTSGDFAGPLSDLPAVADWVNGHLAAVRETYGLADDGVDLRYSDELVLAFTSTELVGPAPDGRPLPAHYAFVGPALAPRSATSSFPWEWLDAPRGPTGGGDPRRQAVLVSLGTLNQEAGARFYATVLDALAPLRDRLQAVVVAPHDVVPDPPDHVLVRPEVPQLELLPHMAAVIGHGGHNTTCEALAHGLPLVLAPIRDDQPIVAAQVERAGAGVRVRFGRVSADRLRVALLAVLDDPSYRAAASRIRASFDRAGGVVRAADLLEGIAGD